MFRYYDFQSLDNEKSGGNNMVRIFDEGTNEPTFLTKDFDEPVLYAPARVERLRPCDSLKIVTAFTDTDRISTHMINLKDGMNTKRFVKNLKVDIILGMTKSSLSQRKHEDICRLLHFINLEQDMPRVTCRYICEGPEVHSKLYIWTSSDEKVGELPATAYCGSLNYTMNAFYKRRETVSMCNPLKAYMYYNELLQDSVDCSDPSATERIRHVVNNNQNNFEGPDNSEMEYLEYDVEQPIATINVSLLKADGTDTGYGSGVNWGIRPDGTKRNPNQAYIPYNQKDKVPGFFPDRHNPDDINCPMFKVITRDFGSFHMRMAQQDNKALQSVESNAILGEWIRNRAGVPSGGYVTKQMLENYGKTYVTFRKYTNGVYLLDF